MKAVHAVHQHVSSGSLIRNICELFWVVRVLPSYVAMHAKFMNIPGLSDFRSICTTKVLRELWEKLPMLERAAKCVDFRIQCKHLEENLKKLPPLEELTSVIADISSRLAEITPSALSLDLDSRRGLPPETDRPELAKAREAWKELRDSLSEGAISREHYRVTKKGVSTVLAHYPCWAVTSLSVGSKIPFMPNSFGPSHHRRGESIGHPICDSDPF